MKKIIIVLFLISLGFIFWGEDEEILIPGEAIRFRVIANSNTLEDQTEKLAIKEQVEEEIYKLINGAGNVKDVRNIIENNITPIVRGQFTKSKLLIALIPFVAIASTFFKINNIKYTGIINNSLRITRILFLPRSS